MAEPFLGQICVFGFDYAPRDWAQCNGQTMAIAENASLYSLIGAHFGDDRSTTFRLPDLRGRSIVHMGQGPGLHPVMMGQAGGLESVHIAQDELPPHSHTATLYGETATADSTDPQGKLLATPPEVPIYAVTAPTENKSMAPDSVLVDDTGGGKPVDIRDPYLGLNVCIALRGIYPSRP